MCWEESPGTKGQGTQHIVYVLGRGDPRESATENTHPMTQFWVQEKVKWRGKSSPFQQ